MRKALLGCLVSLGIAAVGVPAEAHHTPRWYHGVAIGGWWGPPAMYFGGHPERGFIDTDIEPEDARVIVDGKDVGEADDFDGHPGFLKLRPGKHRIEFRHRGYQTLAVDVRMKAGWLFRIEDEMNEGDPGKRVLRESGLPPGYEEGGRDGDRPRRREAPRYEDEDEERDDDGDRDAEPEAEGYEESSYRGGPRARGAATLSYSAGQGRVRFDVHPADAEVYVDGAYRGSARQIAADGGLELPAGEHDVVVTEDGYEDRELTIGVAEGTASTVSVELEEAMES